MNNTLTKFLEAIRSLFHRLIGGNGAELCSASSLSGRYYTLYVASDATFTAVTGGGPKAQTWLTEVPAGTTLTAPLGVPVTAFTISDGIVVAY